MKQKLLVIDDEQGIVDLLKSYFSAQYEVLTAYSGSEALAKVSGQPDLIRTMINAMLWLAHSGAGWEDLPERYGPWKTVYSRFRKWRDDGTFHRIFQALNAQADMENLSLDSTNVKAHLHSAGAKKGL